MDKQHIALILGMGGLTPCMDIMDAILVPDADEEKRVLDVGCGTGVWCIEIARTYPHTSVLGVDLAPTPIDQSLIPPNLSFEIDDVNEGLEHFHGQFDVIHMRSAMTGIKDMDATCKDLQRCLKPGGLLLLICADIRLYGEDQIHAAHIPDGVNEGLNAKGSWARKIVWEAVEANKIAGADWDHAARLVDLGLWNEPLCDPETAASGGVYLPVGPWASVPNTTQSHQLGFAGALMRQVFMNIHRAYHPILRRHGLDQPTLDSWSQKVEKELIDMDPKIWIRFRFCWARRRAGEHLPAPPLPKIPSPSSASADEAEAKQRIRYPYCFVYHTAAEAAYQTQRRDNAAPPFPESEVSRAWARKQSQENTGSGVSA